MSNRHPISPDARHRLLEEREPSGTPSFFDRTAPLTRQRSDVYAFFVKRDPQVNGQGFRSFRVFVGRQTSQPVVEMDDTADLERFCLRQPV